MNPTGVAHESFATPTTHFVVLDAPASTRDAALSALPKMDIALLVVSTDEGPQQTTIDAIEHARAIGVPNIVVYLSKTDIDEDEELYELLELQTRELLSHHGGYDGDAAAILWGSAKEALRSSGSPADPKAASIFALVDAIERAARV
jgi:elongation factor Tu